jgi:putative SOS response-associated peptidase YedK
VSKVKVIEDRFGAKATAAMGPVANVGVGMLAPIITQEAPDELSLAVFGMTPAWAKKAMYLFNARSEGDHNKEDDPLYRGAKGIIEKPAFRKSIRSQRCLVIADAFVEGSKTDGLNKPYLFFMTGKRRPFAFAGVYDRWYNETKGEWMAGFAIITAPANALVALIGHHRCPVILRPEEERKWLDTTAPLADITAMLQSPPAEELNGYPIDPAVKPLKNQDFDVLLPKGERLRPEYTIEIVRDIELFGMGESRSGRLRDGRQGSLF